MWECTWKSILAEKRPVNKYHYPGEEKYRLTEHEIQRMTLEGSFFGALEVDIHVPDHLKAKFAEMTPIFKNTEVTDKDIGEFMTNYLKDSGKSFQTTKFLISPLLKWYLEHGLVVTKIYQTIQFNPKRCFKRFADQVSDDRRAGTSIIPISSALACLKHDICGDIYRRLHDRLRL
jgi:hypothetical protein